MESGANIYAYDPVATENFKIKYPAGKFDRGSIQYVGSPNVALDGADICFIFTEWENIKDISPELFKQKMQIPLVYDGRNLYDLKQMQDAGVEYYCIGRK